MLYTFYRNAENLIRVYVEQEKLDKTVTNEASFIRFLKQLKL